MQNEEWRYVPNFPEYVVSNYGQIRRTGPDRGGRPLSMFKADDGHVYVNLKIDSDPPRRFRLDRIVAFAFLDAFNGSARVIDVYHIDGDELNCRAENLAWRER